MHLNVLPNYTIILFAMWDGLRSEILNAGLVFHNLFLRNIPIIFINDLKKK